MALQKREQALDGVSIAPSRPRGIDQRCEERLEDVVHSAMILFREQEYQVPVVNISSRGTMIECDISPRVGENILIRFENCTPIHGFVRWVRGGNVGLSFGHEIILG